jgi:hypothetical protein
MRFFNRGGELDSTVHPRTYAEEVRIALSAIDAVLLGERAVYASSELTTGRRLYALLAEHGVASRDELRRVMGDEIFLREVWEPYVREAMAMAEGLRQRLGGPVVLSPAPFEAPGWSQPEYLAFWETLIRSRFSAVYFSPDWEYSNGCTFELAVAMDVGLATFEDSGESLGLERARARIEAAIATIEGEGLSAQGLRENLARLP